MNLGWLVKPTAATALGPSLETIMVSIITASARKKLSVLMAKLFL